MSKPISISFGKSKTSVQSPATNGLPRKTHIQLPPKPSRSTLRHDSDDEDEAPPPYQSITAFEATGAILSDPKYEKEDLVIKNPGNSDWRYRGKGRNLLPEEVQAQKQAEQNGDITMVERDEVSKTSGLQYADQDKDVNTDAQSATLMNGDAAQSVKPLTDDEKALQALLGKDADNSTHVIAAAINSRGQPYDETEDFRADVASRPDSCTLEDYAAMPVEEFGIAMLRGMGQKRRANGEIISYGNDQTNGIAAKAREPRQGYLGIGAKAAPGAETELGAWGKTAMRKNNKGEGFYTPVMLRDKKTGEMITEEEFERRKKGAGAGGRTKDTRDEEDWRQRRDRNLERKGRDTDRNGDRPSPKMIMDKEDYKEQMSGFSSRHSSSGRDRDDRPRRERDRSRSGDRDRRRHDNDERHRERRKDRYRDDERYDSSSSRRSDHKDRRRDDRDDRKRDR